MAKTKRCCDNCGHYEWYYDYCGEWKCEVDDRSLCGSWTERKKADSAEMTADTKKSGSDV